MPEVDKIRSAEKEADLDKKIEDIRRRNELLEQRHKLVAEEAKQNGVPKSFQKATAGNGASNGSGGGIGPKSSSNNQTNLKISETVPSPNKNVVNGIESKGNQQHQQKQWSREWDRGKTSAEEWKMNVPEFGDHGNSYFKTAESNNAPNGNSTRGGRGRGGGLQARGNGRRPNPTTTKNPGFFHDDRCDKNNKNEENPSATTDSVSDGKNDSPKKAATIPPRNTNFPRKQQNGTTTQHKNENDRNQNDSNKPNMNITSSGGSRQDRRGGGHSAAAQPLPSQRNAYQSRRPFQSGGGPTNSKPQTNGAPQSKGEPNGANSNTKFAPKRNEIQRKPISTKDDGNKLQQNNGSENPSGPSNRGRNFKPYGKPTATGYNNNPRQNKVPSKTHATSNGSGAGAKPQSPKLDKDGQAVKRLIDNVIDQVVRQERKEQQKKSGEEETSVKNVSENNEKSEEKIEETKNENANEKTFDSKVETQKNEQQKMEEKMGETKVEENNENSNKNETKLETSAAEEPNHKEASAIDEAKKDETKGDSPSAKENPEEISQTTEISNDQKTEEVKKPENDNNETKADEKQIEPLNENQEQKEKSQSQQATENA